MTWFLALMIAVGSWLWLNNRQKLAEKPVPMRIKNDNRRQY